MFEDFCHLLDIKIATVHAINDKRIQHDEFDKYVEKQIAICKLENTITDCDEKIELVHDALATNIVSHPEREKEIKAIYIPRIEYLTAKKDEKV